MDDHHYLEINRIAWNERTRVHVQSAFYDQASFLKGRSSLKEIELSLLGELKEKKVLHLQCHFGQDTLSLARMGAEVVGVDLSDEAIKVANETTQQLQLEARFICCDLYDLPKHLDATFDMVFTTYGTIGWLPDIKAWANIVSQYLKPGGELIFVDFHPVVWMMDNDLQKIAYRYFNDAAIVESLDGTYADKSADLQLQSIGWNHGIAEVIQSLLEVNMELCFMGEYDYSPYNVFPDMEEVQPSRFQVRHLGNKIPLTYALKMRKK